MPEHIGQAKLDSLKKVMEAKVKINRYAKFEEALKYYARNHPEWGEVKTEFRFHPIRKWRADVALPKSKLLIEINGGFFCGGRHGRGMGAVKDMEKLNAAQIMGYDVLQFTPQQVNKLEALKSIGDWFDARNVRYGNFVEFINKQDSAEKEG